MPEIQFKRIVFAAGIKKCTTRSKLENFLKMCEEEEEGEVISAAKLQDLKDFSERLLLDYHRFGVEQQLSWGNVKYDLGVGKL